jgi:hypothetical protein
MNEYATLTVDVEKFKDVLSSLTEVSESLLKLFEGLTGFSELSPKLFRVVVVGGVARGADKREVRLRLEPSDRCLDLLAALQAGERQMLIAKELIHAAHG